jgi:uncharacterized protein (TIGR02118 family)
VIHQLIFAHPKPGMSERDFQDYWLNHHGPKLAAKVPQIRRYMIDSRVPFGPEPDDPLFSGVAEIWLENEQTSVASLQTPELRAAREDEPNWAAFWQTVVLNTDAHVLKELGPPPGDGSQIKYFVLMKRKEGLSLPEFRRYALEVHAPHVLALPGLRRYYQCHQRDAMYGIGEPGLDAAAILWFDNVDDMGRAFAAPEYKVVQDDFPQFAETKYIQNMAATEQWIIGPEFRE